MVAALDKMGDWIDLEPGSNSHARNRRKPVDEITFNKIMALQAVFRTGYSVHWELIIPFDDWKLFEKAVIALNGFTVPNFAEIESATPLEIHRAIMMLEKIHNCNTGQWCRQVHSGIHTWPANIVHCPFYKVVDDLLEETTLKKIVKEAWKDRNRIRSI